jgi:hypothetical protein
VQLGGRLVLILLKSVPTSFLVYLSPKPILEAIKGGEETLSRHTKIQVNKKRGRETPPWAYL